MIEKILNEISRLKKELNGYSASEALDYIESYINILSRANEDLEEELRKILDKHYYFPDEDDELKSTPELAKYIARHFAEWGRNHFEDKSEMTNNDLEEAATKWDKTASFQPFYMQLDCNGKPCGVKQDITTHKDSFKAGAEWQKQQMKEALQTEYEKGRFDMREEMMKDAVDGEVVYQIGSSIIAPTDIRYKVMSDRVYIPNVKLGDKVKIIIVKEEQQ